MEAKKKFSRALFDANDSLAKQAGFHYAAHLGAKWVSVNKNDFGCDLVYKTHDDDPGEDTPPRLLEVEIKHNWKGGPFPYLDINVLHRKEKYWLEGAEFLMLAGNFQHFLTLDAATILASEIVEVPNKYVFGQEYFYKVPVSAANFYRLSAPLTKRPVACDHCGGKAFNIAVKNQFLCEECGQCLNL